VFYTDGSRMDETVASAAVHNNTTETTRLPNGSSIFVYATMLAVALIHRSEDNKSSAVAEMGHRLAITDIGRKFRGVPLLWRGSWVPI